MIKLCEYKNIRNKYVTILYDEDYEEVIFMFSNGTYMKINKNSKSMIEDMFEHMATDFKEFIICNLENVEITKECMQKIMYKRQGAALIEELKEYLPS